MIISYGDTCSIETEDKNIIKCFNRRKLGVLVCGDWVEWSPQDEQTGVIHSIKTRQTELARIDRSGKPKPIASNFDHLIITVALRPEPDTFMIDSYLAFAEQSNIKCSLLINKADLINDENQTTVNHLIKRYQSIGYTVCNASIKYRNNIEQLEQLLDQHTSILVGQSGVGKSSIIKLLLPDSEVRVGELCELSGLGAHTTTTTLLYHLPHGGDLIDSPGVRQFTPYFQSKDALSHYFIEFRDYLGQCKFNNCTHQHEPGCAIINAIEKQAIDPNRHVSYLKILESINSNNAV